MVEKISSRLPLLVLMGILGTASLVWAVAPTPSTLSKTTPIGNVVRDVEVVGTKAYLAVNGVGLVIMDVSNPSAPKELGQYKTIGSPRNLAVNGNTVYMATKEKGLLIIDVSDPTDPPLVKEYAVNKLWDVDVRGKYAYLASGTEHESILPGGSGLVIVDVSDPSNPKQVGVFRGDTFVRNVVVKGKYAYVSSKNRTFIVDVSNPRNPRRVGVVESWGKPAVSGNHLYLAASSLLIYNVSNPKNPELVGKIPHPQEKINARDVAVAGDLAVVAGGTRGVRVYNVSDPTSPELVSHLKFILQLDPKSGHYLERAFSVDVSGDAAYVGAATRREGILYILDLSNL